MYPKKNLWVVFKYPINVQLIFANSNTHMLNELLECTLMVNRHTSIFANSNTPTNEALGGHSIGQ
jgi:hypothetical protein